jgi:hypothetical protein
VPILRSASLGFICGLLCGIFLARGFGNISIGLAVGAVLGTVYALALPRPTPDAGMAADRAMTTAAFGLTIWGALNVILLPLLPQKVRSQLPKTLNKKQGDKSLPAPDTD